MRRIIDGYVYEGKAIDGEYTLHLHDFGNGQREAVLRQAIGWEEVHKLTADEIAYFRDKYGTDDGSDPETEAERRARSAERAARRAKTRVRRLVKSMGLDSLLTLTWRENMTDEGEAKRCVKEFVRRMRRVLPGFAYVAAFERQQRGAWHVHLAIHRLPRLLPASNGVKVKSWNVVRAVWRSVVGLDNGTINEKRRKLATMSRCAKLAAYLSMYMLKACEEGADHSHRYTASSHSLPAAVRATFRGSSLAELVALAYAFAADGPCTVVASWLSRWGETFFLASESLSPSHPPG